MADGVGALEEVYHIALAALAISLGATQNELVDIHDYINHNGFAPLDDPYDAAYELRSVIEAVREDRNGM